MVIQLQGLALVPGLFLGQKACSQSPDLCHSRVSGLYILSSVQVLTVPFHQRVGTNAVVH